MIGIEIITGRLEANFGSRLENFLNEYPKAEILSITMRGMEGGKGMIAILKYDKKEAPKPKDDSKAKAAAKVQASIDKAVALEEAEALEAERASKKAQIEKLKAEIGE